MISEITITRAKFPIGLTRPVTEEDAKIICDAILKKYAGMLIVKPTVTVVTLDQVETFAEGVREKIAEAKEREIKGTPIVTINGEEIKIVPNSVTFTRGKIKEAKE